MRVLPTFLLILGKDLSLQRKVTPYTYLVLHNIPHCNLPRSPIFWKPPVIGISPHVCANPIALCTKTRYTCSAQITPACGRLLDSMRTGGPGSRIVATPLWITENIGNLGKWRQPPMLKAWHTHGNMLPGGVDFYPLLAKVGKGGLYLRKIFIGDLRTKKGTLLTGKG